MSFDTHLIDRRSTLAGLGGLAAAGVIAGHAPTASASPSGRPLIGPAKGRDLHVMSFNIRYDREGTAAGDPDYWPEREPILTDFLALEKPTLLGIQEGLYSQLPAIEEALPRHRMLGYGREGGSRSEYSSIFYEAARFTVVEWDQFWLSDTPEVMGSATWGNRVTRIVVWARMRDHRTGKEFVMVNTHFDHESEEARVKSAQAIAALVATFDGKLPVIVTGDFNSTAGDSGAYTTLVGSGTFRDTWVTARRRLTDAWGTFPNYKDPVLSANRIDWVLATPRVRVAAAAINTYRQNGRYPSDHTPVQALVTL